MKYKKLLGMPLAIALILSGCSTNTTAEITTEENTNTEISSIISTAFSDRDMDIGYDTLSSANITLSETTATSDSNSVIIDGTNITISNEGTYIVSGTLNDGMIIVDVDDTKKVQIVLNNANIHNNDLSGLYVKNADKVFVTTAENSENTISSGETFVQIDDNNIDGAVFSKSDITFNGLGILNIISEGEHGVVSKDSLTITCGTYNVEALKSGLSGKDDVCIADGTFNITSGKDGIKSENTDDTSLGYVYIANGTFDINSEGDGISASNWLQTDNGTYNIVTGGGSINGETHTDNMTGGMGGRPNGGGNMGTPPERPESEISEVTTPPERLEGEKLNRNMPTETLENNTEISQNKVETTEEDTVSTKGIKATNMLIINEGTYNFDCADDAFHSNKDLEFYNGTVQIKTGDDAFHADEDLKIYNGNINIEKCYEGLEGLTVEILDGNIDIISDDDGINAAGGNDQSGFGGKGQDKFASDTGAEIIISGGNITINAEGDGIDSNGNLTVSGGNIYVMGASVGADTALDYDGEATIIGGTIIGVGLNGMTQNFGTNSTQGSILISTDNQEVGSEILLKDSTGKEMVSWQSEKSFSSVLISSPDLKEGETYSITAGTYTNDITLDSLIYRESRSGQQRR